MRKRTKISLTTIPINHIFFLAILFCKERTSRKPKQGRPLTYPEHLILTLGDFCRERKGEMAKKMIMMKGIL